MAKKRKTKQQKIILQLKRELAKKQFQTVPAVTLQKPQGTEFKARQEAISVEPKYISSKLKVEKKSDNSIYFYDPRLVMKDLKKTAFLTFIAISLELVLYLRLR